MKKSGRAIGKNLGKWQRAEIQMMMIISAGSVFVV
jgi:hypothetical protein